MEQTNHNETSTKTFPVIDGFLPDREENPDGFEMRSGGLYWHVPSEGPAKRIADAFKVTARASAADGSEPDIIIAWYSKQNGSRRCERLPRYLLHKKASEIAECLAEIFLSLLNRLSIGGFGMPIEIAGFYSLQIRIS